MTGNAAGSGPERFDVLAALVEHDEGLSDAAAAWTRVNGEPFSAADVALLDSAAEGERELAAAVRGPAGGLARADAEAIAALLRFAAESPLRSALAVGLRVAFLDGEPEDRAAAFADVYRRLALPALDAGARDRAGVLLGCLGRRAGA